jgi:hypothetical protein
MSSDDLYTTSPRKRTRRRFGSYDVARNRVLVNGGTSHDTAEFGEEACGASGSCMGRRWRRTSSCRRYNAQYVGKST